MGNRIETATHSWKHTLYTYIKIYFFFFQNMEHFPCTEKKVTGGYPIKMTFSFYVRVDFQFLLRIMMFRKKTAPLLKLVPGVEPFWLHFFSQCDLFIGGISYNHVTRPAYHSLSVSPVTNQPYRPRPIRQICNRLYRFGA